MTVGVAGPGYRGAMRYTALRTAVGTVHCER